MTPIDLVKLAHLDTTGDRISNPTAAELYLACLALELMAQLRAEQTTGYHHQGRAHTAKVMGGENASPISPRVG